MLMSEVCVTESVLNVSAPFFSTVTLYSLCEVTIDMPPVEKVP